MCLTEKEVGQLLEKVDTVDNNMETITKILYGNGKEGILQRVTRIEECINSTHDQLEENKTLNSKILDTVDTIKNQITGITQSFSEHTKDDDVHTFKGLLFKKDVIGWVILGIIFLHSILPQTLDLFELLKKYFGL